MGRQQGAGRLAVNLSAGGRRFVDEQHRSPRRDCGNRGARPRGSRPENRQIDPTRRRRGRHGSAPGSRRSARMPFSAGVRHAWRTTSSTRIRHSWQTPIMQKTPRGPPARGLRRRAQAVRRRGGRSRSSRPRGSGSRIRSTGKATSSASNSPFARTPATPNLPSSGTLSRLVRLAPTPGPARMPVEQPVASVRRVSPMRTPRLVCHLRSPLNILRELDQRFVAGNCPCPAGSPAFTVFPHRDTDRGAEIMLKRLALSLVAAVAAFSLVNPSGRRAAASRNPEVRRPPRWREPHAPAAGHLQRQERDRRVRRRVLEADCRNAGGGAGGRAGRLPGPDPVRLDRQDRLRDGLR